MARCTAAPARWLAGGGALDRPTGFRTAATLALAALASGLPGAIGAADPATLRLVAGRNETALFAGGQTRTATVYVPDDGLRPGPGWPLVLVLHGAGGSARSAEGMGWHTLGARDGFVTIYADGTSPDASRPEAFVANPKTWNAGLAAGLATEGRSAAARGVDDVAFLLALLDAAAAALPVDARRVFVAGHSNGASMAMRLASERPERFAAVGAVAGHLGPLPAGRAPAAALLRIVGSKDPFVPLGGGEAGIGRARRVLPAAIDAPRRWALELGLAAEPEVVRDDDELRILRWWDPARPGCEVRFVVVKGHGHEWPGHESRLPAFLMGPSTRAMDATETIWRFFQEHPAAGDAGSRPSSAEGEGALEGGPPLEPSEIRR